MLLPKELYKVQIKTADLIEGEKSVRFEDKLFIHTADVIERAGCGPPSWRAASPPKNEGGRDEKSSLGSKAPRRIFLRSPKFSFWPLPFLVPLAQMAFGDKYVECTIVCQFCLPMGMQ